MYKVITTTILAVFLSCFASAQKKVAITGTILEKHTNTPLEWATVVISNPINGKIITGGTANQKGEFNFKVNTGTYNIAFEFINFETVKISNKKINSSLNFGTIYLKEDATTLQEVELIAEKTTVEIKLDKKIYNVGKDLTVSGGTVSDVLDNVPSVSVDVEGNVALRGNDNVRILINGKPSGLVGLNSTDALRQLPAESIEKIEVITSPSARYDAEGTGGILNIILRRSKLQGLNGAITTNVGYNPSAGISGNINYRTGDVNFFNTTSYNYREVPGSASSKNQNFNLEFDNFNNVIANNPDIFKEETSNFDRVKKNFNTNLGVEWYITNSASLTTSILYSEGDNQNNTTNKLNTFDVNRNLLTSSLRLDPELEDEKTIQYSLNFDKQFKTNGNKLTFDFQYEEGSENEKSLVNVNGITSEKVLNLVDSQRILLQTDYVLPIGKKSQFEIGYRGNFNTQTTDYIVSFLNESTNTFTTDQDLTNLFIYKEYLNALYTQFGSKIGKFSYLLGLRMENTRLTLNQPTTGSFNKKNYIGLFPTVNLSYKLSESENITLAYNRRLRRPRSFFINPFPSRSSVTSIFQGNPDLDPSYSGQFNLGYLKRFGKFTLDASAYYSHATDGFSFINFDTGETVEIEDPTTGNTVTLAIINRTPINLATEDSYGTEFTLAYKASKKWSINANFNIFEKTIAGITPNGLNLGNTNTSWFARLNNKYTLPGKIDWQTRLSYKGPKADALNKRDGIFSASFAFSKDLFKEKASLTFNVNDVFNSRKRRQTTTTPTYYSESEFQWRERSFNLSFTYRFNQKKKRQRTGYNSGEGFEG